MNKHLGYKTTVTSVNHYRRADGVFAMPAVMRESILNSASPHCY